VKRHTILVELKIESKDEDSTKVNERVEALMKHGTIVDAFDSAGMSVVEHQCLVAKRPVPA
jgi:hypothetical protein